MLAALTNPLKAYQRLQLSATFSCEGEENYNTAACVFSDLVYWRGHLYLINDNLTILGSNMNVSIQNQERHLLQPYPMLREFVKSISQVHSLRVVVGITADTPKPWFLAHIPRVELQSPV